MGCVDDSQVNLAKPMVWLIILLFVSEKQSPGFVMNYFHVRRWFMDSDYKKFGRGNIVIMIVVTFWLFLSEAFL